MTTDTKRDDRHRVGPYTFLFNILLGIFFWVMTLIGRIRVVGWKNIPRDGGFLMIANHPSLAEPVLMPALMFPWSIFDPRRIPFCTPDPKVVDNPVLGQMKDRYILIPREHTDGSAAALFKMVRTIRSGCRVILFPEGGRTFRDSARVKHASTKQMRPFKFGVGKLIKATDPLIIPVWIEGTDRVLPNFKGFKIPRLWRKMSFVIGEPLTVRPHARDIRDIPTEEILEHLEQIVMNQSFELNS